MTVSNIDPRLQSVIDNVNTIVVRIPTTALQGTSTATVLDTWVTISIPDGTASVN